MIKWQYAHIFFGMRGSDHVVASIDGRVLDFQNNPRTPWDVLNELGAEGWELVTTLPTQPVQTVRRGNQEIAEGYWIIYLKRPLPAE